MNILRSVGQAFRKGADLQIYGAGGGYGSTHRQRMWQPGSHFAYDHEAGRLYDNGVVLPTISWKVRVIGEARLVIEALGSDGKWTPVKRSQRLADGVSADDVLAAFEEPNDYYDLLTLLGGVQLSWDVRGHAFLHVRENNAGKPMGFNWVFHDQMRPLADVGNPSGTRLVTRYEYRPNAGGALQYFDPAGAKERLYADKGWVAQITCPVRDPLQPACGLSPLAAELRDVCLDNEVSNWLASIVRNGATPGVIVSPKAGVNPGDVTAAQKKQFGELWDSFVGDKRGKALPMPLPVDITVPTWSPQQMELGKLRDVPMVRIMAALGVDPLVLGLTSEKSTFANKEQAIDDAGKRTLLPTINAWVRQLTHQTFRLWGIDSTKFRLAWDVEGVSWLLDDKIARDKSVTDAFKAGYIDRYTAKVETGREASDEDKGVYATDFKLLTEEPEKDEEKPPAKGSKKSYDLDFLTEVMEEVAARKADGFR